MHDGDWYAPDATTFGDRLAGARESAGLTQKDLAERLGVKLRTIKGWEQDQSEPRSARMSILAGMLNVSLPWLMTGVGRGPAATSPEGADLLDEISALHREAASVVARIERLEARLRASLEEE